MKNYQFLLLLLVLFLISCNDDDAGRAGGNGQMLLTETLTIRIQEPIYDGFQAWGIVSDDDGQPLGYNSLIENQETEIQYEVPINYDGKLHFSVYQFSAGQEQSIRLRTFSDINAETIYLKSDQEQVAANYNHVIQITPYSDDIEDPLRVLIVPDNGYHRHVAVGSNELFHTIRVNENDRRFFIAALIDDNTWKYDYIVPEADEDNLQINIIDLEHESENIMIVAEGAEGWTFNLRGLVEENNMERWNTISLNSSQDTSYNNLYDIQGVSDVSIPAILLEKYDHYKTTYAVGSTTNNPTGGYNKNVYGSPQLSFNPIDVDYTVAFSDKNCIVETTSDFSYTNIGWLKNGNGSLNERTYWFWDAYGPINQNIVFPILPAELNDQIHEKIETVNEFDNYLVSVVNDSKFSSYELLLEEFLYQEENKNRIIFPFAPLELSLDKEIEVSYIFKDL